MTLRRRAVPLSLYVLLLAAAGGAAATPAAWTVMVYWGADCVIEEDLTRALYEMAETGGSRDVNVLVLVDRSKKLAGPAVPVTLQGYAPRVEPVLYRVLPSRLEVLPPKAIAESPEAGLRVLLDAGFGAWDAARHALIVKGKSGGVYTPYLDQDPHKLGNISEDLQLDEVVQGMAPTGKRRRFLDFVGLDTCLLAHVEACDALADHARYAAASETLISTSGWNFRSVLADLRVEPQMDAERLARRFVYTFRSRAPNGSRRRTVSERLALVDLRAMAGRLRPALGMLSAALLRSALTDRDATRTAFEAARRCAFPSPCVEGEPLAEPWPHGSCRDLLELSDNMTRLPWPTGDDVPAAARRVASACAETVPLVAGDDVCMQARSVLVFAPSKPLLSDSQYSKLPAPFVPSWARFLVALQGTDTGRAEGKFTAPTWTGGVVTARLHDLDPAYVRDAYLLVGGGWLPPGATLGALPASVGPGLEVRAVWDAGWFFLESGGRSLVCPLQDLRRVCNPCGGFEARAAFTLRRGTTEEDVELLLRIVDAAPASAHPAWTAEIVEVARAAPNRHHHDGPEIDAPDPEVLRPGDRLSPRVAAADSFPTDSDPTPMDRELVVGADGVVTILYRLLPQAPADSPWQGVLVATPLAREPVVASNVVLN